MRDIIVKTVLITLASIFGLFLIVFGALAIFSPLTLAQVFDGTGGYSSSIRFYQKHYEKTENIEDLAVLALKINQEIDCQFAEECFSELVNHKDFDAFCAKEEGKALSNKEFYVGEYVSCLVKNSKLDTALEIADNFVKENGYSKYNPYSALLIKQGENLSVEQLDVIKLKLESYSAQDLQNIGSDIEYINYLKSKKS